jgi:phage terminase small subunit
LEIFKKLDGRLPKKLKKQAGLTQAVEAFGEVFAPDHLMPDAQACIAVIQESMPPQVYRKMDSFLLAAFGLAWAIHKRAAEEVAKKNFQYIVFSRNGIPTASPWLKLLNEQARTLVAVGGQLGLDPRSRQGLRLPEAQASSKFDGLIGPVLTEQNESSNLLKN